MNKDFIFRGEDRLLTESFKFFFAKVMDPCWLQKVVQICLENPSVKTRPWGDLFVREGHFSWDDFFFYFVKVIQPGGGVFKDLVVHELVRRMCEAHLLIKSDIRIPGADHFTVNEPLAKFLLERDALENLCFDVSHLAEKYADAVVKLVVTDEQGDEHTGSGIVTPLMDWVITNRHVVEECATGIPRVLSSTGDIPVDFVEESNVDDLAFLKLSGKIGGVRPLFLHCNVSSLDEVVTLGYPRIPLSLDSSLVAHKGEINGLVQTIMGKRLLFSAKTSPGNSGGPLLDRAGLVVGIVAEELYCKGKPGDSVQSYCTAIPSCIILENFLEAVRRRNGDTDMQIAL